VVPFAEISNAVTSAPVGGLLARLLGQRPCRRQRRAGRHRRPRPARRRPGSGRRAGRRRRAWLRVLRRLGQKWLCGPEGSGCLYVRADQVDELTVRGPATDRWPTPIRRFDSPPAEHAAALTTGSPRDAQRLGAGLAARHGGRRLGVGPPPRRSARRRAGRGPGRRGWRWDRADAPRSSPGSRPHRTSTPTSRGWRSRGSWCAASRRTA